MRFEQLGETRLPAEQVSKMRPPDTVVADVVKAIPWRVSSLHKSRISAHVNVQGLAEVKGLLERLCNTDLARGMFVNGVDSRVVLGFWAKGRSPSYVLNGI